MGDNERRSRGFGFIALKDHHAAMKTLEYLNDNPKVFGGTRRPIVEFAIEDKRKLRMQEELYQKHAHKLMEKKKSKRKERREAKRNPQLQLNQPKPMSRGQRQREKRRKERAEAEEKAKARAVAEAARDKAQKKRNQERAEERPKRPPGKRHEPDAGFAASKAAKRPRPAWEISDDFELRAMERFRNAGR